MGMVSHTLSHYSFTYDVYGFTYTTISNTIKIANHELLSYIYWLILTNSHISLWVPPCLLYYSIFSAFNI